MVAAAAVAESAPPAVASCAGIMGELVVCEALGIPAEYECSDKKEIAALFGLQNDKGRIAHYFEENLSLSVGKGRCYRHLGRVCESTFQRCQPDLFSAGAACQAFITFRLHDGSTLRSIMESLDALESVGSAFRAIAGLCGY